MTFTSDRWVAVYLPVLIINKPNCIPILACGTIGQEDVMHRAMDFDYTYGPVVK